MVICQSNLDPECMPHILIISYSKFVFNTSSTYLRLFLHINIMLVGNHLSCMTHSTYLTVCEQHKTESLRHNP